MTESSFLDQLAKERAERAAEFLYEFYRVTLPDNVSAVNFYFVLRYDDGNTTVVNGTVDRVEQAEPKKRGWFRAWMASLLWAWAALGVLAIHHLISAPVALLNIVSLFGNSAFFLREYERDR